MARELIAQDQIPTVSIVVGYQSMPDALLDFLSSIGEEVVDAEEESFLLFSRTIPSNNLGFLDSRATTIDLTINSRDYTIHQSPTLLSSTRDGGTTGAVLWKITPLFASWISSTSTNPFWLQSQVLRPEAAVIELGCGISGLVALTLAPLVRKYVATDQEYVRRFFRQNIDENRPVSTKKGSWKKTRASGAAGSMKRGKDTPNSSSSSNNNIEFIPLDWELDVPRNETLHAEGTTDEKGFDVVISCDCIYNEALIPSFVRTCADICLLRSAANDANIQNEGEDRRNPTMAIIAQQQRSPDVFEAWLEETLRYFRVWRVEKFASGVTTASDEDRASSGLGDGSGYVVHVLVLRGDLSATS